AGAIEPLAVQCPQLVVPPGADEPCLRGPYGPGRPGGPMLETLIEHYILSSLSILLIIAILVILGQSIYSIGPTQVGLVRKRFGDKLPSDNPVAFRGEAGYQAELLMPGLRFKLWLVYAVTKHPWVQVPAGQIGIVIAQV